MLLAAPAWAADQAATLWRDEPWGLGWDERLAAIGDPALSVGYAAQPRPAAGGVVVRAGISAGIANTDARGPWPGVRPSDDDGMLASTVALDASWWRFFLRARSELRLSRGTLPGEDQNDASADSGMCWRSAMSR
jgi:hypothetical protein